MTASLAIGEPALRSRKLRQSQFIMVLDTNDLSHRSVHFFRRCAKGQHALLTSDYAVRG